MKKLLMFVLAVTAMFLASCGKSPREVAEGWMQACAKGDTEKVGKFCTANGMFSSSFIVEEKDMLKPLPRVTGEKVNGEQAVVTFEVTYNGTKGLLDCHLIKQKEDWKVNDVEAGDQEED